MSKFSFNLTSTEFVPTTTTQSQYSTPNYYEQPILFPEDPNLYYQQVVNFLDYALTKENITIYFPEAYVQYQENREIVVSLNSVVDLLMKNNITPVRDVVQNVLQNNEKIIYDTKTDLIRLDPNYRTCIVLRDFNADTDQNVIYGLFGESSSHIIYMNFDLGLWYIWFNSAKATQAAFSYLDELRSQGQTISAFIKSDTVKTISFLNPNYQKDTTDNNYNSDFNKRQAGKNNDRNNKRDGKQRKAKGPTRPTEIAIGDDFPPLDNIVKGGYEEDFKRYTMENIFNIVSKRVVSECPESEIEGFPLLEEQNMTLEQSKKILHLKDVVFLSDQNKNRKRKGKKGRQNKNRKRANQNTQSEKKEVMYSDVVKDASPVKKAKAEEPTANAQPPAAEQETTESPVASEKMDE